jgi:tyrosine-protein kinase Etk/Wzc
MKLMQTVNEISPEIGTRSGEPPARAFDILDILTILAARKYTILLSTIAGFVIAVLWVLTVQPDYTAKAMILPPEQEQSTASAMLGQFGGLASMAGLTGTLGIKTPADLYIGILQSQSLIDSMIKRFDLMHLYHVKHLTEAQGLLKKRSKFVAGKDGMITISVTDQDPKRAAAMANAFVDELYKINNRLALGTAAQKRLFYEQQLAQEKERLADAEVELTKTEEATGVIAPTGQTEVVIQQIARLQAEITEREVQLDALRTSSTEENPDVIRLNTQLSGLREQLKDLENGRNKRTPGDISITTANVPKAGLEYIRKERDVKYHQFLFDLLARQYEAARIDEAKTSPVIQVVDTALVPDKKSAPTRMLWAVVGTFLGFALSTGYVLGAYVYRRLAEDEEQGRRLALLRQELKLRS